MTDTSITNIIIGVFIMVFIAVSGSYVVSTAFNSYAINDNNDLNEFKNASLQSDLETLGFDMEQADADSVAKSTDTNDNIVSQIGKVMSKSRAIKNITLTLKNMAAAFTSGIIPTSLWVLAFSILGIIITMLFVRLWTGRKP